MNVSFESPDVLSNTVEVFMGDTQDEGGLKGGFDKLKGKKNV